MPKKKTDISLSHWLQIIYFAWVVDDGPLSRFGSLPANSWLTILVRSVNFYLSYFELLVCEHARKRFFAYSYRKFHLLTINTNIF